MFQNYDKAGDLRLTLLAFEFNIRSSVIELSPIAKWFWAQPGSAVGPARNDARETGDTGARGEKSVPRNREEREGAPHT